MFNECYSSREVTAFVITFLLLSIMFLEMEIYIPFSVEPFHTFGTHTLIRGVFSVNDFVRFQLAFKVRQVVILVTMKFLLIMIIRVPS